MLEDSLEYFKKPHFRKILGRYEKAIAKGHPLYMEADDLTDIAEYYMVNQQEEQADDAIQLAVSLHPSSVDPQVFLARQQMFRGNLEKAQQICQNILEQDDDEVKFLKAELLIHEGKTSQAMLFLENEACLIDEDRDLFLTDCAGIFMEHGMMKEALVWAEQIISEFPNHKKGKIIKVNILIEQGEYKMALPILQDMLENDPYDIVAWNLQAESQGALGLYLDSIESTEYILAIEPNNNRAKLTRANCYFHQNRLDDAHEMYQELLSVCEIMEESQSLLPNIQYMNAVCLSNMCRYPEAAVMIELAMKSCNESSAEFDHLLIQQAYVESKLHHFEKALNALKTLRQLAENIPITSAENLLAGEVYLENGKHAEAEEYFQQAVNISPCPMETKFSIALAYGEIGDNITAIKKLKQIKNEYGEKKMPSVIPYLAYFNQNQNNQEEFLHFLEFASEIDRETTEFLFSTRFPNILPEDYYMYAYYDFYGRFPKT